MNESLGSHQWSLWSSPGPWKSSDGVTVDMYTVNPAMWGASGSSIGRIGVICHEMGHYMGAADMYDTDGGTLSRYRLAVGPILSSLLTCDDLFLSMIKAEAELDFFL